MRLTVFGFAHHVGIGVPIETSSPIEPSPVPKGQMRAGQVIVMVLFLLAALTLLFAVIMAVGVGLDVVPSHDELWAKVMGGCVGAMVPLGMIIVRYQNEDELRDKLAAQAEAAEAERLRRESMPPEWML